MDLTKWQKLAQELDVEMLIEDRNGSKHISLPPMDQTAYKVVAGQTIIASIKSGEANKGGNLAIISASMATIEKKAQRAALPGAKE